MGSALVFLSGCIVPPERSDLEAERVRQQNELMRQKLERDQIKADVERLREHVAALDVAREEMNRQIELVRLDSRRGDIEIQQRMAALDAAMKRLEAAQSQMRGAIVDEISRRVAEMLKAQADAAVSPAPVAGTEASPAVQSAKARTPHTHVVKRGESLSKIAEAYGVTPKALMEANGVRDANRVLVGQKLVIPSP
jgi:LysM repeat protein